MCIQCFATHSRSSTLNRCSMRWHLWVGRSRWTINFPIIAACIHSCGATMQGAGNCFTRFWCMILYELHQGAVKSQHNASWGCEMSKLIVLMHCIKQQCSVMRWSKRSLRLWSALQRTLSLQFSAALFENGARVGFHLGFWRYLKNPVKHGDIKPRGVLYYTVLIIFFP